MRFINDLLSDIYTDITVLINQRMLGVIDANIRLKGDSYKVTLEVIAGDMMSVLLDRNVLNSFGYS